MRVLVDTSVWSLAFRRKKVNVDEEQAVRQLQALILEGNTCITGVVLQELLSGIKHQQQYEKLKLQLQAFDDIAITRYEHELAAEIFNTCRGRGIQGSHIDFLICAVAVSVGIPVFAVDGGFPQYAEVVPVELYCPPDGLMGVHETTGKYG